MPRGSGSPTTSSSTKASGACRASRSSAVRASIPSDRSFAEYDTALAHLHAPPLPAGSRLAVAAGATRRRARSADRVAELAVLAQRAHASGSACASSTPCASSARAASSACSRSKATPASSPLDPRWHQSLLRFLVQGFEHILDGADHLLVLAVPRRAVSAATAGARLDRHGVHGRPLGDADRVGLWFGAERAVVPAARRDADRALDLLHGASRTSCARSRARVGRSRSASGSCTASASRSRCRARCSSPAITC